MTRTYIVPAIVAITIVMVGYANWRDARERGLAPPKRAQRLSASEGGTTRDDRTA